MLQGGVEFVERKDLVDHWVQAVLIDERAHPLVIGARADELRAQIASTAAHRAELEPIMEARFAQHTCEELLETLLPAGMPCSAVNTVSDLPDNPQVKARKSTGALVTCSGAR